MKFTTNNRKRENVYIHGIFCDYPGCLSYKIYSNEQAEKDFNVDSNLISDGWSVIDYKDSDDKIFYCPEHTEYIKSLLHPDRWVINAM